MLPLISVNSVVLKRKFLHTAHINISYEIQSKNYKKINIFIVFTYMLLLPSFHGNENLVSNAFLL